MKRIRRVAAALGGLALTWLGLAVAAPAAFAIPPPGSAATGRVTPAVVPTATRTLMVGGTPGWQIILIAAGTAVLAAALAVLADRAWTAHRHTATTTA